MDKIKDKPGIQKKIGQLSFLGVINDKETDLLHKLLANDDCTVVFEQTPMSKKGEITGQMFEFNITMRKVIEG